MPEAGVRPNGLTGAYTRDTDGAYVLVAPDEVSNSWVGALVNDNDLPGAGLRGRQRVEALGQLPRPANRGNDNCDGQSVGQG